MFNRQSKPASRHDRSNLEETVLFERLEGAMKRTPYVPTPSFWARLRYLEAEIFGKHPDPALLDNIRIGRYGLNVYAKASWQADYDEPYELPDTTTYSAVKRSIKLPNMSPHTGVLAIYRADTLNITLNAGKETVARMFAIDFAPGEEKVSTYLMFGAMSQFSIVQANRKQLNRAEDTAEYLGMPVSLTEQQAGALLNEFERGASGVWIPQSNSSK
jgi:hypothetical protein